jgi:hypothetical protein
MGSFGGLAGGWSPLVLVGYSNFSVEEHDHSSLSTYFVGEVVDLVPFSFGLSLVNHCGIEPNRAWQDGWEDGFVS